MIAHKHLKVLDSIKDDTMRSSVYGLLTRVDLGLDNIKVIEVSHMDTGDVIVKVEKNKTPYGIVFQEGSRDPIILYNKNGKIAELDIILF